MALPADQFEILQLCRERYLQHLSNVLLDHGLASGNAIHAIQEGAGKYFDEIVTSKRRGTFAEEADGLTSSRLTLVGEDDMELGIRLDNLSARLFETAGVALWKIHLRFMTLLRRPDLPKTDNPVGPKGISQGLSTMFTAAGASSLDQKLALLDRIEDCLRNTLPGIYAEVNDLLDRGGIETAQVSIVSSPTRPRASGTPTGESALAALQQSLLSRLSASDIVGDNPVLPGSAAAGLHSQAMLEQLMFRLGNLERQGHFNPVAGTPGNTLMPNLFGDTAAAATSTPPPKIIRSAELGIPPAAPEGLAIDTLGMIFEAIYANPELPDALKAIISSLQITLLKVAIKDSTLFMDADHPARRIVDHMAQAMIGLPLDAPARHPVCARGFEIAAQLRNEQGHKHADFAAAQVELDALIADRTRQLLEAGQAYKGLIDQLDESDQRALQATEVIQRYLAQDIPAPIRHFLDTCWRPLLLSVAREQGIDSPTGQAYATAFDDLLWTVKPKTDPEDRKALGRRVPLILKTLKAGMDQSAMPPADQESFLDQCFALQTLALRATSTAPAGPAASGTLADAIPPSPKPLTRVDQSGAVILTVMDFNEPRAASAAPECVPGDWLKVSPQPDAPQAVCVSYISPNSHRILALNPDLGLAIALHADILTSQLQAGTACYLSDQSLFESAASQALGKKSGN